MNTIHVATDGYLCSPISIVANGYLCIIQEDTTSDSVRVDIQPKVIEYTFRVDQPKVIVQYTDGLLKIQKDNDPTVFIVEKDHIIVQEEQLEKAIVVQPEILEYVFRVDQPKIIIKYTDGLLKIQPDDSPTIFMVEETNINVE